jgi:hypothetical protein
LEQGFRDVVRKARVIAVNRATTIRGRRSLSSGQLVGDPDRILFFACWRLLVGRKLSYFLLAGNLATMQIS